jgi:hypothetical protein
MILFSMQLTIQPRNFEDDPTKQYQVSRPLSVGIFLAQLIHPYDTGR